jgi:hypothetical protein
MAQYITANNIEPTTLTALSGPKIQSITYPGDNTAVNTAGGDTVVLTGTGFVSGCTVLVNGSAAPVVTFNSSTSVEFIAPALAAGGYAIYLVNPDGGTAIAVPGLQYSGVPAWSTASGSVGSVYETTAFNSTVTATGDAPVAYSLYSGSLPTGANLNSSTGLISGTSSATASTTTYNFTIRATDAENQDTDRAFSITVNPDVVTWSAPADNAVYSVFTDTAISAVTLSANSAAGYGVQYTANTLPTGLSLTANVISGTPTVEGTVSTLLTATANTSSRTAQRTINWVVSVGGDIYLPYVTTLLSASNSANVFIKDSSTNNFSVSVAGDTRPNNFNPYTPGYYSNYFDGTGDYLRVPSTGAGFSSITTFTYECWIYPTAALGTNCIFDISECQPFRFVLSGTNVVWQATSSGGTILTANYTWTIGAWHHVVFVRDNSNNISIFVNGTRYATTTYGSWGSTSSGGVNIGCNRGDTWFFPGYISNARFVKGTAVYDPTQTTLTVPTIPLTAVSGTSLLMCQSNRFIDNSVDNLTVTRNGDVSVSGFDPFTPDSTYATYGSTYFDGNGDYLTVPSNSAFAFGTGNYTIEAWVYITVSAAQAIVGNGDGSVANPYFYINGTTPTLYFNNTAVASGPAIPLNVWTHVAVTRSGTLVQVFTNGVAGNGATNADSMISSGLTIGASSIPSQFITGYISNLRIVKGTAVYTSAFTPSTQPLTAIAGTSLLTLQTNQPANNNVFIDNSTNNFLVTRNGNATPGTFSPYGAGWSNYFDGVDDYLLPTSTTIANFSTSDFTVECWLNLSALGSTRCIMDARDKLILRRCCFKLNQIIK